MGGFSNEVRFKIGGDTSPLRASFVQATAMAETAGKAMEKSLSRIDKVTSSRGLLEFRRKVAFEEANTVGKIKITTERLAALSYQISRAETGTTRQKKLQLDFDKERAKLAILRKQQASDNLGAGTAAGAAAGEESQGRSGLGIGQLAFRAIGGAIAFGLQRVIAYNESRVRVSDAQGAGNAEGLASLRSRFATVGGLRGQLTQGQGTLKDLERQKQFEEQRRNFLTTGAQGAVSLVAPEELEKSETAIAKLNGEIQKQHDANALIERDLNRQTRHYNAEKTSVEQINDLRSKGLASETKLADVEAFRLKRITIAEEKFGTPESAREARLAEEKHRGVTDLAQQQLRQRLLDVNQDLTGQAAEGRTFANGRARPLSETERLARRAQQFRERARRGILTGAGGDAGRFIDSAIGDEATVANRLSAASAGVTPKNVADATSIKPEIVRSNQLLESIKNSLAPVDVD